MNCELCNHYERKRFIERKDALVILGIMAALALGLCLGWIFHSQYIIYLQQYDKATSILQAAVLR